MKLHLYNRDTKKSWCGMAKRGNVTQSRAKANCKLCDYQRFVMQEKLRCQRIASQ